MKRKDEVLLGVVWAILYIPYVLQGGWVQDDLALLTSTRLAQYYAQWQWFVSTNRDMTGRPVSAILHGLCYWLLGSDAWRFHLVNLILFGATILLFYLAVRKLISREVALVSALLALVYPCASTVVFSSIMMNSNLAAFFWCGGLYVSAGDFKHRRLLTTALFAMSALSYEAFIPLFAFGSLCDVFVHRLYRSDRRTLLLNALPAFGAVIIFAVYRGVVEKLVFHAPFSRLVIAGLPILLDKFLSSTLAGLRVMAVDSLVLSARGFTNLGRVPVLSLALLVLGAAWAAFHLYKSMTPVEGEVRTKADARESAMYLGLAASLLVAAHLIFVLSNYTPSSLAFENRVLEGVQFSAAVAIALLVNPICRGLLGRRVARMAPVLLIAILSVFMVGIVGQRQAWILAGQHNEQMATEITDVIRRQNVSRTETLKMLAVLPLEFPGQINNEPTLRVFWDITPLLELQNPDLTITADVYTPAAKVTPSKITIDNYGLVWEVTYPFWLYSHIDQKMYWVRSQQDWNRYLQLASTAAAAK